MIKKDQASSLLNYNHLKKMIDQDPEGIAELVSQKELTKIMSLSKKDQDTFMTAELATPSKDPQTDYLSFYQSRKKLWTDVLTSNPAKALDLLKPIFLEILEDATNTVDFILTETKH